MYRLTHSARLVIGGLLVWNLLSCDSKPTQTPVERERERDRAASDERAVRCGAGEHLACTALHHACLDRFHEKSCSHLMKVSADVLSANPEVFDDPLQYVAYMCFDKNSRFYCDKLRPYISPSDEIQLGLSEAEEARIVERLKAATKRERAKNKKRKKSTKSSKALKRMASDLERAFGEDAVSLAFDGTDDFTLLREFKRLCEGGHADACHTYANRWGSTLNATHCDFGCGDMYRDVNAAVRRARDLYAEACWKQKDRIACFKNSLWEDKRVYSRKRSDEWSEEDLSSMSMGYRRACELGLLDGCNASVRHIIAFRDYAKVARWHKLFSEELREDSGTACELTQDPASTECELHLFVLLDDASKRERTELVSRRASELDMDTRYRQLAFWEHAAYPRERKDSP